MSTGLQNKRFVVGFPYVANWTLVDFKQDLPQNRACAVCGVISSQSHIVPCSHVFCVQCYKRICEPLPANTVFSCPLDNKPFNPDKTRVDCSAVQELRGVRVGCKNRSCRFEPSLFEYESHIAHCEHQFVLCQLCSRRVEVRHVLNHVRNKCSATRSSTEVNSVLGNTSRGAAHAVRCEMVSRELKALRQTIQEEISSFRENLRSSIKRREEALSARSKAVPSRGGSENLSEVQGHGEGHELFSYNWNIRRFSKFMAESFMGLEPSRNSEYFFVTDYRQNKPTYRMCLRVSLNRGESSPEVYLGVYFILVSGPYDNSLSWPYSKSTSIVLKDQVHGGSYDVEGQIDPLNEGDDWLHCFTQPHPGTENEGFGFVQFISLPDLMNPEYGYVHNDSIEIQLVCKD